GTMTAYRDCAKSQAVWGIPRAFRQGTTMHAILRRGARWGVVLGFLAVLGLLAVATVAVAGGPPNGGRPERPGPRTPLERFAFEARDKPWASVFEWLTDKTGLPVVTVYRPTGTFNLISPKTEKGVRKYTIPEIIDLINEALLAGPPTQKFILIRRTASFTLVHAEDK